MNQELKEKIEKLIALIKGSKPTDKGMLNISSEQAFLEIAETDPLTAYTLYTAK